jgi:isopenicillin-N N-acyltransferase like protein
MTGRTRLGDVPILHIERMSPRERGRAHGEALREMVRQGVADWKAGLEAAHGAPADRVISEFLAATGHAGAVGRHLPDLLEEVRGIADGSGLDPHQVFAYNLWDEEQIFRSGGPRERCTTAGLRAGAAGVPISAQNMDIPAAPIVALHIEDSGGGSTFVPTLAGMIGLLGVNSHGVSVLVNALHQLPASPAGVPVAFIIRAALAQRSPADALASITGLPHASGQNYLIGSSEGLVCVECSADATAQVHAVGNAVWHANHPVGLRPRPGTGRSPNSLARDAFVSRALAAATSVADVEKLLADRTVPVCKRRGTLGSDTETIWSMVVEHHAAGPQISVAPGPPDRTPWHRLSFPRLQAGR